MDLQVLVITAADTVAIAAVVASLTQFTKALLPGEGWGPYVALCWTALAVGVAVFSAPEWPPIRTSAWPILSVFANVLLASMGVYHAAGGVQSGIKGVRRRSSHSVLVSPVAPDLSVSDTRRRP
jgi:hypothetical protein